MPKHPAGPGKTRRASRSTVAPAATTFGQRVRAARKAANLTLENLSDASGVSRAALSKIERDEMSPTYDSLLKLARGLGMDLATLVSGREPAGGGYAVTRAGEGARHEQEGRYLHRLLAPELPDRALFAFVTEVRGARADEPWHAHNSEDFLYVLEGTLAVHLADRDPVELHAGDSLQMDGRIGHSLVALAAPGSRSRATPTARVLWISVPFT